MKKLRWGILGAARIAWKNWKAIYHSGNSVVAAVASRDANNARRFVEELQRPFPFDPSPQIFRDYEALLASPEVDAVYIPLPTTTRKEWVLRAAQAGKHVLSEKPCAVDVPELRELLDCCRQNEVQFMDGVMFTHCNRLPRLRATLDDPDQFGQIRRINSNFNFLAPEGFQSNIRVNGALEPLGCLGDVGWYCIRLSLWAMNWQLPLNVTGRCLNQLPAEGGANAVPLEFSGELVFTGGVSAGFYCSFMAEQLQQAQIIGSKGCVELADFVLPFTTEEVGFQLRHNGSSIAGAEWNIVSNVQGITVGEHGGAPETAQETNMIRNFVAQIRSGKLNTDWPAMTLKTQIVLNACLESARQKGQPVTVSSV